MRKDKFDRNNLPDPQGYFFEQGLKLTGNGLWRLAVCPFHNDTKPSLGVNVESGAFKCHACGAKGGDLVAFHQLKYSMGFKDACKALGAWKENHARY